MTFTEIVNEVMDQLNLTSSGAQTRVGRTVNRVYRKVTAQTGINISRITLGVSAMTTSGNQTIVFEDCEKVVRVYHDTDGLIKEIQEVSILELREKKIRQSDTAHYWATYNASNVDVYVLLDIEPLTEFEIKADVYSILPTLSGSDVPLFPESFHDLLVYGTLIIEYQKMEKVELARQSKAEYEQLLSEFKYFLAKSAYIEHYQKAQLPHKSWAR